MTIAQTHRPPPSTHLLIVQEGDIARPFLTRELQSGRSEHTPALDARATRAASFCSDPRACDYIFP